MSISCTPGQLLRIYRDMSGVTQLGLAGVYKTLVFAKSDGYRVCLRYETNKQADNHCHE